MIWVSGWRRLPVPPARMTPFTPLMVRLYARGDGTHGFATAHATAPDKANRAREEAHVPEAGKWPATRLRVGRDEHEQREQARECCDQPHATTVRLPC